MLHISIRKIPGIWVAILCICLQFLTSCRDTPSRPPVPEVEQKPAVKKPPPPAPEPSSWLPELNTLPDTSFIRLADYSADFGYEMRYAGTNNFLETAVYPCGECYTRAITARALLKANAELGKMGYRIRFFDCYRPNSVQYKMWEIMPNPQYVANPVKGSIHNRGGAVDITLETLDGRKVDMGTDFDYFGPRAHHDHMDLPEEVLENRKRLKETMEGNGFWSIRTEWWHYNLNAASRYPVSDWVWECPSEKGMD